MYFDGIDAPRKVRGVKVDPPSKNFIKLVNENFTRPQKGCTLLKNFHKLASG